ncbi:hypothetical protein HER32_06640 [Hymenobacter sp. BT18]|uniref:hypothetical protein n=1 Tax=Hymenobacter sp. BT18 TaxID=2835648 RepID=UPI00143E123B|nr:hypothetical protein [Hymenobacter sp. BT18]QIX60870.1 hypothetical protein HER32_06640 [Hymenobacter sp. BT18]
MPRQKQTFRQQLIGSRRDQFLFFALSAVIVVSGVGLLLGYTENGKYVFGISLAVQAVNVLGTYFSQENREARR